MTDRRYEKLSWKIGDIAITRLVEVVLKAPINSLFPEHTPDELSAHDSWLRPNFLDEDGDMILSVHAFLIRAGGLNIIVDTCAGNGKKLPLYEEWNDLNTPFLENMTELGFAADKIDRVLCTHLHFDHVGWNTHLVDGQWIPTFPNARYLFGATEWEFWKDEEDPYESNALDHALKPIFEANQVDLVDSTHQICDGISLIPTPGHTPGHVSIHIQSNGEEAVITGDMFHHPCQMANPDWIDAADTESSLAEKTRIEFMQRFGNTEVTILGTHFATPTAGKIISDGPGYKFES